MRLPLKYSLRSVTQRRLRSLLTSAGIAVAVFMAVLMIGLSRGLASAVKSTGEPLNLLVLSKGAESLEFSAVDPEALHILGSLGQLALDENGELLLSAETYTNPLVELPGSGRDAAPVIVRGVRENALSVHEQVTLAEGTAPQRGYQIAVGPLVATRLGVPDSQLAPGRQLRFDGQLWTICGLLSAPGTAFESEIWAWTDDVLVAAKRSDYSVLVLRARDAAALEDLEFDLKTRTDVRSEVHRETAYFGGQAKQLKPVQAVALLMTVLLVLGGMLAGMNTMFNSIVGRTREMAVLLVVGYRRRAVLLGFIVESVLLSLGGGVLGCAAGLTLNGLPMKFAMGAFRFAIDAPTLACGLLLAVLIGVVGAALPLARVARLAIVEGLRAA